jgi:hypothetical protein
MSTLLSRRRFTSAASAAAGLGALGSLDTLDSQAASADHLPRQDPAVVKEMVTVSHVNAERVRELLELQPALSNAAIDWGFGDWEDALGAAAHTGRREIAEMLLAHGARMSIFAAAMLGHLDTVRALVAARPGIQRTLGPHGIPLLLHAKAGGRSADAVVQYLESLGDAGRPPSTQPLDAADRSALVGRYVFGPGPNDYFDIDVANDQLLIGRPGATRQLLWHSGNLMFFPSGVVSVKIAFARQNGKITQFTVADPAVFLTAKRP